MVPGEKQEVAEIEQCYNRDDLSGAQGSVPALGQRTSRNGDPGSPQAPRALHQP